MRWDSVHNPTGLVDMVHAGWMQRLLRAEDWRGFPGPGDDRVGGQTRIGSKAKMIFEKLSELGISYVYEPPNSIPGAQDVRPVDEVLSLRQATCLDMCVTYCCAALDAGIYPLILTLTRASRKEELRHAIVLVPLERSWSTNCEVVIETGFSCEPLIVDEDEFKDIVIESPDDPSGMWLAIDVQQASAFPGGKIGDWDTAISKGANYVRNWEWDLCVDIGGLCSRRADDVNLPTVMGVERVLIPAYIPLPKNPTPLQLIQARCGVVPFCSRHELRTLRRWAMTPTEIVGEENTSKKNAWVSSYKPDVAVAVVTGVGGSGKTRMAAQLCHDLSSIGWYTGFLPTTSDLTAKELNALVELTTELLVVVDCAEESRRGQVARVLWALRNRCSPTRIVLTARGTDIWWDEFCEELESDGIQLARTLVMPRLEECQSAKNPELSKNIYYKAVRCFAELENRSLPHDLTVPENPGATAFDMILRAWLAVVDEGDDTGKSVPVRRNDLYDRILEAELAQWKKIPVLAKIDSAYLCRVAASLSLLTPDPKQVDEVLSRLTGWVPESLCHSQFAEILVRALMRPNNCGGGVSIHPDSIADHLIVEVFGEKPELLDDVLPLNPLEVPGLEDPNADELVIQRALAWGHQAQNVCAVITRAASLDAQAANRLAKQALKARPHLWRSALDVALTQGGPFAPALEELIASGADLPLAEIEDAIPSGHGVLRGAALAATRRLAASAERSPEQRSRWANTLAIRLSEVGERGEALEAAREAEGLYRSLAEASPAAYTPDLASSLSNLSVFLSEVGERGEALEAAREAVSLRRDLVQASPAAYASNLASSLSNLAGRLSEVGERDLALKIFTDDFDRFSPATRARILLARASWCYDNQKKDLIAAAHEADGKDVPVLLGSVRREIAHAVANSRQILEGLPSWAIVTIDTEMRSRIESWLNCGNLAERADLLEKMWMLPSGSDCAILHAAAELYADVSPIRDLAVLVDRVAEEGAQNVALRLRRQYRAQMFVTDWYSAHKSGRGGRYLREHMVNGGGAAGESYCGWDKNIVDPDMRSEVFRLLEVNLPEEAGELKNIFRLADLSNPESAYEVYGRAEGAEDVLEELLRNGNWRAMIAALEVHPSLSNSGYGNVAAAFAAAMIDDADRALEFMERACRMVDSVDRRRIERILEHVLHEDGHPQGLVDLYEWFRRPGGEG